MKEANNVGTTVLSFCCVSFIELSDLSHDVTTVHVPALSLGSGDKFRGGNVKNERFKFVKK